MINDMFLLTVFVIRCQVSGVRNERSKTQELKARAVFFRALRFRGELLRIKMYFFYYFTLNL
jgi:hypothetical protein